MKDRKIKQRTKNWWRQNLANIVTVSGVIFAFLFLRAAALEFENIPKQIIYALLTAATDLADGRIARSKKGAITIFGSYIDRIRDRIFIFPGIIILAWQHQEKIVFPELFIGLMLTLVFFEFLIFRIGFIGYWWHRRGKEIDLQSSKFGQKKMFAGFAIVLIWLFSLFFEYRGIISMEYSAWLIYFGLALMNFWSYISWQEYANREIEARKTNKKAQ